MATMRKSAAFQERSDAVGTEIFDNRELEELG
jgi:hypothetical protein